MSIQYCNHFTGTAQIHADLSPLDCYQWGHLETLAYSGPFENEDTLH